MKHIAFYVPKDDVEKVKQSMFAAGAGKLGHYEHCCFMTEGIGQFKPLKGSHPTIGKEDELEYVVEMKVEMICDDNCLSRVISALKSSHPYETPAYYVIDMVTI